MPLSCLAIIVSLSLYSLYAQAKNANTPPLYTVNIPQPYNATPDKITICTTGDSSSAGGPELGLFIDESTPVIQPGTPLPAPGDCAQFSLTTPAQQVVSTDITVKLKVTFSVIGYSKIGLVKFGSIENLQNCQLEMKYTYHFFSYSGSAEIVCSSPTERQSTQ